MKTAWVCVIIIVVMVLFISFITFIALSPRQIMTTFDCENYQIRGMTNWYYKVPMIENAEIFYFTEISWGSPKNEWVPVGPFHIAIDSGTCDEVKND